MIVGAGFGILIGVGIASAVFACHNKDTHEGASIGIPPARSPSCMSKVKPPKDTISEPVISFVECVRNNPRRFTVEKTKQSYEYTVFTLVDNKTTRVYSVFVYTYKGFVPYDEYGKAEPRVEFHYYPKFMTEAEMSFVYKSLKLVYTERKDRYRELKNQRERHRLTKIYKESV